MKAVSVRSTAVKAFGSKVIMPIHATIESTTLIKVRLFFVLNVDQVADSSDLIIKLVNK